MKVKELVEALEIVAPTLGPPGMVPIMEHFWFTGTHVVTYDDHLGMQAPCSIGLKLTASGRLLPLLKATYQEGELKFTADSEGLRVSSGKFKATLPSKDIRAATRLFTMPEMNPNAPEVSGKLEQLRLAIEACKLSMDDSVLHRNGITIVPEDKELAFYALSNDSLTRCVMPGGKFKHRIMLPAQFWNILLSLTGKKGGKLALNLSEERALAQVDDVLLYAKTVEVPSPPDLRKLYDANFTDTAAKRLVTISAELVEAVQRAAVLSKDDKAAKTTLTVEDGVLNVYTDSLHGEGDDRVTFDHPDAHVMVKPAPLLDALERFTDPDAKAAIGKRVVALSEPGRVYLLSGTG